MKTGNSNILQFILKVKFKSGAFWLENGRLKVSIPKTLANEETKNFISTNKADILEILEINNINSFNAFNAKEILLLPKQKEYRLSFAQERMIFIDQYEQGTNAYNIPILLKLNQSTDITIFTEDLHKIVKKYEILRTIYSEENGTFFQKVNNEKITINNHIVTTKNDFNITIKKLVDYIFDLKNEIPIKIDFISFNNETYTSIIVHHIAFDGWSIKLFLTELDSFYLDTTSTDHQINNIQYNDYAEWQRCYLTGEVLEEQLKYWKIQLTDFENLNFPIDKQRPAKLDYTGNDYSFKIDKETSEKLKQIAKSNNTTLYCVLLSAYYIFLHKYTQQEDLVLGTPTANRHFEATKNIIGFFVNSLPLRIKLNPNDTILSILNKVSKTLQEAQMHQDIPFEKLVDELNVEKDVSRHPVFQTFFSISDYNPENQYNSFSIIDTAEYYKPAKFDFSMFIDTAKNNFECSFEFATSLFELTTIKRMANHFTNILHSFVSKLETPIQKLNILSEDEFQTIVYDWNKTETPYPSNKTLHALFEEQVKKTPDNIAVVFKDQKITYRELNNRANQLAHTIRKEYKNHCNIEVESDTLIGIYIERSIEMTISILGILKAGAAYVPFDRADPEERLKFKINDCKCRMILTSSKMVEDLVFLSELDTLPVSIDSYWNEIFKAPTSTPEQINKSTDLAYVIYTSGSTGNPKGTMIEHKSVVNLLFDLKSLYNISARNKRVTEFTSYNWDVSVSEIFSSLWQGGELYILSDMLRKDSQLLSEYILKQKINFLYIPPSLLSTLPQIEYKAIKKIIFAGEPCDQKTGRYWANNSNLYNYFGPTEATIYSSGTKAQPLNINIIGKPLSNIQNYILDKNLSPVPIGTSGELYISGDCLSRGYLNNSNLTADFFINNPFISNRKMYITGDRCRWLSNGTIEFLGRLDNQIKIYGFRVELTEIESTLLKYPNIKQCIVTVHKQKSGNKVLLVYYTTWKTPDSIQSLNKKLKEYLSGKLPNYMTPSFYIHLKNIPLNTSGKVDRKKLPKPNFSNNVSSLALPKSKVEKTLSNIWQNLLSLNKVGINSNFFSLGGNSLLTIKLKNEIEKHFNNKIAITDLFTYTTIEKLAKFLTSTDQKTLLKLVESRKNNSSATSNDIAVIGYSGEFPDCEDIEKYWENILEGKDCISRFTKEEASRLGIPTDNFDTQNFINASGIINDIDKFDADFFNIPPNEAELLDPMIRLFMEHSWKALESSGYITVRNNLSIGVFAGASDPWYLYYNLLRNNITFTNFGSWLLNQFANTRRIATRTSYSLNLSGPSLFIDAACSTSLITIIEACNSLQNNNCHIALAGGATVKLPIDYGYQYKKDFIVAEDGYCKTFDKNASGTVFSSGIGIVVLKKLDNAIKDHDNIIAVIKGYGMNNDGNRKMGYTAPSPTGQTECILQAQKMANIEPNEISYIECHGTATKLGDPIEIKALNETFKGSSEKRNKKCYIGSVKANIGHTDAAAGVASFLKVCKILKQKKIPPQINYNKANPDLNLSDTSFCIPKKAIDLSNYSKSPLAAGVSSFGIGGTNAHIILQEAPIESSILSQTNKYNIFCLSAKSSYSLNLYSTKLANFIKSTSNLNLNDLAYSLNTKRYCFNIKKFFVAENKHDLLKQLSENSIQNIIETNNRTEDKNIVFMFSGQGSQYNNMAKELYITNTYFKQLFDKCARILEKYSGYNINDIIFTNDINDTKINNTLYTQPAIFIVEYCLAKLLISLGIKPSFVIGHSIGEFAAAAISDVFTLEHAIKVVYYRAKLMSELPKGSMLAIGGNYNDMKNIIPNKISIAAINSELLFVVSGKNEDINLFSSKLKDSDVFCKKLKTSHAFHSYMMTPMLEKFKNILTSIDFNLPNIPFISTLTGQIISNEITTADYWTEHIIQSVIFKNSINNFTNIKEHKYVFIEIGPGNTLINLTKTNLKLDDTLCLQSLPAYNEKIPSDKFFINSIGKIWQSGINFNFSLLYPKHCHNYINNLPTYEFDKQRFWIESDLIRTTVKTRQKPNSKNNNTKKDRQKDNLYKRPNLPIKYVPPKTNIEIKFSNLWSEIFKIKNIGLDDDFFSLGGNSIMAIELLHKMNSLLTTNLTISDIFTYKTIRCIVNNSSLKNTTFKSIDEGEI